MKHLVILHNQQFKTLAEIISFNCLRMNKNAGLQLEQQSSHWNLIPIWYASGQLFNKGDSFVKQQS